MLLHHIKKPENLENQLFFDFQNPPTHAEKIKIADRRIHDITKRTILFHKEGSIIADHTFTLKIRYKGRSYKLNGVYRKEHIRSFSDASFGHVLIHIHPFSSIFAFRNGHYDDLATISNRDYDKFLKYAETLLSDPRYNETLARF